MDESAQENIFHAIKVAIESVVEEKKADEKTREKLEDINARLNIGLQDEEDDIFWVNLTIDNGNFQLNKGQFEEYDLELIAETEDLVYFVNGTYSTLHMIFRKNRFGNRKLQIHKGTTGWNLGLLLKLPKLLVID